MKIIVTGALGHIGSKLFGILGHHFPDQEIILIDNMMTQRYSSLFNMPAIGKYHFIEKSLLDLQLSDYLDSGDCVVHLSAITDAESSVNNRDMVEKNNYESTCNVALACAEKEAAMILLSSTSVYGTQTHIVTENCGSDVLKPQSPYAETKLREEKFFNNLVENGKLSGLIFRFGTIFGISRGMRFHTAVNKFCWQASLKKPLTVWETAYNQKRPYLHLDDACAAITFAIEKSIFSGKTYNILTGNYTVKDIVDQLRFYIPELTIEFVQSSIMNQLSYEVSNDLYIKEGFYYNGSLQRGIEDTVNLLKNINRY